MEGQSVGKSASAANVSGEKESNNKEESNAGLNANGSGGASSENGGRKAPYKRSYNNFSYRGGRRFYSNNKDDFAGGNSGNSGGFGRNNFRRRRRRVCEFCAEGLKTIDYKDASRLSKFLTDRAKIVTRRSAGTCAQHQRELATALKRARYMALLPYCNR